LRNLPPSVTCVGVVVARRNPPSDHSFPPSRVANAHRFGLKSVAPAPMIQMEASAPGPGFMGTTPVLCGVTLWLSPIRARGTAVCPFAKPQQRHAGFAPAGAEPAISMRVDQGQSPL
jgi:hypothetical protein